MKKMSVVLLAFVFLLSSAAMAQARVIRVEKKSNRNEIKHDIVNLGAHILHYIIDDHGHTVVYVQRGFPGHRGGYPHGKICRHRQHRKEFCQICRR